MKKLLETLKQKATKAWADFKKTHFYQSHKEEALAIPAVLLLFFFANWIGNKYEKGSAFFDIPSQLESLIYSAVRFCATIGLAWLGIRIMAPPIYRYIVRGLYPGFDNLPEKEKRTATLALVITLLLCAATALKGGAATTTNETRAALIKDLNTTVGIHETTPNAGPEVTFFFTSGQDIHTSPLVRGIREFLFDKTRNPEPEHGVVASFCKPEGYNLDTQRPASKTTPRRYPDLLQLQAKASGARGILRKDRPRWLVYNDRREHQRVGKF